MKKIIGQPNLLKRMNSEEIESIIAEKGPISKPELSKLSGLSLPTVNKLVLALENEEKVKAVGLMGQGAGRKATVYVSNNQSGNYLIMYYQNDNFICSITDMSGEEQHRYEQKFTPDKNNVVETLFEIVNLGFSHCESEVKAIGVGVPGVVKEDGVITNIPNIPELEGINLKALFEEHYKIPTFVENDIKLTAVGYYHSNCKDKYKDMIYVYIGKGLGSGIIINKKLHKGPSSFAGEFGYMLMASGISEEGSGLKRTNLEEQIISYEQKKQTTFDEDEIKVIDKKMSQLIMTSVINMICILNPEVVVIGGEIMNETIFSNVEKNIAEYISEDNRPVMKYDMACTSGIEGAKNMCISNISSSFRVVRESGV